MSAQEVEPLTFERADEYGVTLVSPDGERMFATWAEVRAASRRAQDVDNYTGMSTLCHHYLDADALRALIAQRPAAAAPVSHLSMVRS